MVKNESWLWDTANGRETKLGFLFCLVRKFRLLIRKSMSLTQPTRKTPPSIPRGPTKSYLGTFPTTDSPFATDKRPLATGQQVAVSIHLFLLPLHTFPTTEASSATENQLLATPQRINRPGRQAQHQRGGGKTSKNGAPTLNFRMPFHIVAFCCVHVLIRKSLSRVML